MIITSGCKNLYIFTALLLCHLFCLNSALRQGSSRRTMLARVEAPILSEKIRADKILRKLKPPFIRRSVHIKGIAS